ncbi:indolepyruvate ferredoxin oxidoreductase subunit alpha [Thermogladius sp.]|uniref:indolepyruvate ferredoxin oxidoreductase subunit alpha n=1 Tax=Thermogladius sp. TaxID=2023064 RepID=UPI003D0AF743
MSFRVVLDPEKCDKCMLCVDLCPLHVFYTGKNGEIRVDDSRCIGCFACVPLCPRRAIKVFVDGKSLPEGSTA